MSYDLLVKFPTRGRPDLFKSTFDKYLGLLSGRRRVLFVVTMVESDETMNTPEMRKYLEPATHATDSGAYTIRRHYGPAYNKIGAMNANIPMDESWKVLLGAQDDMIPEVQGYDDIICSDMERTFPDTDGMLFYPDGLRTDGLAVLTVMGRKWFDRTGYVYPPYYTSVYCDNEYTDVARDADKLARPRDQIIIRHCWHTVHDEQRKRDEQWYGPDGRTYRARAAVGFPADWPIPEGSSGR